MTRIMYEVRERGKSEFDADVLIFTSDLTIARHQAELSNNDLWEITYEGTSWTRWKQEKLSKDKNQLSMFYE